jgi:hypothetical protein
MSGALPPLGDLFGAFGNILILWNPRFQATLEGHIAELKDEGDRVRLDRAFRAVLHIVRNPA